MYRSWRRQKKSTKIFTSFKPVCTRYEKYHVIKTKIWSIHVSFWKRYNKIHLFSFVVQIVNCKHRRPCTSDTGCLWLELFKSWYKNSIKNPTLISPSYKSPPTLSTVSFHRQALPATQREDGSRLGGRGGGGPWNNLLYRNQNKMSSSENIDL
jgi:hypothetical protein